MAFENFQRELYEKKLETKKYFSMAFEILKVFINENKLWTIFFVIANIWKLFSNIIENRIYDYKFLIFILNLIPSNNFKFNPNAFCTEILLMQYICTK